MTSTSDNKLDYEKEKSEVMQLKKKYMEMLFNQNYCFNDNPFEPSSDKPIDEDKLTSFTELKAYLKKTYGIGEKLELHRETIKKIIGTSRAEYLIKSDISEYFKVLAHFTILSNFKRGWFNLFVTSPTKTTKPSLSDNPSLITLDTLTDQKKLDDAIISCFYSRLFQGMTKQEKERYQKNLLPGVQLPGVQLPEGLLLTRFNGLLTILDNDIEALFCLVQQNIDGYTIEKSLPDLGLDEAIKKTRNVIHFSILNQIGKEGYRADSLRATLIKFASINFAINDRDAILNIIHNEVIDSLPNNIQHLKHVNIKSESEILPAIKKIFNYPETKRKKPKLPDDHLIKCSKLVCKMYIDNSPPPAETEEVLKGFSELHMKPYAIAVSAALLYHDYLQQKEINLNTSGAPNKYIPAYKTLSDLAIKIETPDVLNNETLYKYGFPQELFKYLTIRYSIFMFGQSDFYSIQVGAKAHLRVKIKKHELHKEAYEFLKDMSVKDARQWISNLHSYVIDAKNTAGHPLDNFYSHK